MVVDDADLPLGELRLRPGGSSGGHHGLESIEQHLGTREYARLRIGIGRQSGAREITGYVLGRFSSTEAALADKVLTVASDQAETWLEAGIQKAMSQFNGVVRRLRERRKSAVKRYEGLFILETAAKEEGIKDAIDKISADITTWAARWKPCRRWTRRTIAGSPTRSTAPAFM